MSTTPEGFSQFQPQKSVDKKIMQTFFTWHHYTNYQDIHETISPSGCFRK